MENTDMVNRNVKLYLMRSEEKKPEDYKKKYCHPNMHSKNYPIKDTIMVNHNLSVRTEYGDRAAMQELAERVREVIPEGEVLVCRHMGGKGRKGKFESDEHWRAKRSAGWMEILRL